MKSWISFQIFFLVLLVLQGARGQYDYEEEENEEESESEVEANEVVASAVKTPRPRPKVPNVLEQLLNMNFTEQFAQLTAHETSTNSSILNGTKIGNETTTRRPVKRTTTAPSRGQVVGQQVNGILNSVGSLNIPGIVDSALGIREDNDETREFVRNIMDSIFCAPFLQNFSNCGRRWANRRRPKPTNATTEATIDEAEINEAAIDEATITEATISEATTTEGTVTTTAATVTNTTHITKSR